MELSLSQKKSYAKERLSAIQAQRLAQEIAFGPIVFQVSRLMVKFGILQMLAEHRHGLTMEEIAEKSNLSKYAVQVLLESSLTIGTILLNDDKFTLAKTGFFLLNDEMVKVNMNFNHDVNYLGLFDLEASLLKGKPEGLKVFGNWPTIYEGLSQLPDQVQQSWFGFDHFYSDHSFEKALEIIFAHHPQKLLDVGGNTGRFASKCVEYNPEVTVTIMDLPQQLVMMKKAIETVSGKERILGHGANLLDSSIPFPKGFDAIWMSQFLDCFSEEQVINILSRAARSMNRNCRLYIMETTWDRQHFETASFCLAQTSVYFTALANGNSKMFCSDDLKQYVQKAGLQIEKIYDEIGFGHSIFQCIIS
ncbi:MAG: methyltransferase [Bacteroidales bacterium]